MASGSVNSNSPAINQGNQLLEVNSTYQLPNFSTAKAYIICVRRYGWVSSNSVTKQTIAGGFATSGIAFIVTNDINAKTVLTIDTNGVITITSTTFEVYIDVVTLY